MHRKFPDDSAYKEFQFFPHKKPKLTTTKKMLLADDVKINLANYKDLKFVWVETNNTDTGHALQNKLRHNRIISLCALVKENGVNKYYFLIYENEFYIIQPSFNPSNRVTVEITDHTLAKIFQSNHAKAFDNWKIKISELPKKHTIGFILN